jgi:hypothetical protein
LAPVGSPGGGVDIVMRSTLLFPAGLVATLTLAAAACSSASPPAPAPTAQESFIDELCALFDPCCKSVGLASDATSCHTWAAQNVQSNGFYPAATSACLSAMKQHQKDADFCTSLGAFAGPACAAVFEAPVQYGMVPPGGACTVDSDCQIAPGGGVTCHVSRGLPPDGGTPPSTYTCVQTSPGNAGDGPCLDQVDDTGTSWAWPDGVPLPARTFVCNLADGIYCEFSSHTCKVFESVGDACDADQDACGPDAYCPDFGRCTPLPVAGQPCVAGLRCAAGLKCIASTCVTILADGAPCTTDDQCEGSCLSGRCVSTAEGALCPSK